MNPAREGTLLGRLIRGARWNWVCDDYRGALPDDLSERVMSLESSDRFHAKQGRSTSRVRFDTAWGGLSVYLKKHERLGWRERIAALVDPAGRHSPAGAEWRGLQQARSVGIPVPDAVAAGERIGPWGQVQSYLMVLELEGWLELNEALPRFARSLNAREFARIKRRLILELADVVARLHANQLFHKDLYLCHVFVDPKRAAMERPRLALIDLHRLRRHRWSAFRWRVKDLAQLLYSTMEVREINDRDRLRFWRAYRRLNPRRGELEAMLIRLKAARYLAHNS